jgi:hypothetical protein
MAKYFFDLAGELPAHDLIGLELADDAAASEHARVLASKFALEKPELAHPGNHIAVLDSERKELFRIGLPSADG